MSVSVAGSGAFGVALAIALSRDGTPVTLWGRDEDDIKAMQDTGLSGRRLPGHRLPESLSVTSDPSEIRSNVVLLAVPTQKLSGFLEDFACSAGYLVACCKGVDRKSGRGPVALIEEKQPGVSAAMLTGPSFATDIAAGLPTALVLASRNEAAGEELQTLLSRTALRLYRTTDVVGAELGGALKNVIALASGIAIGSKLGDSARASVIARGFAEMTRFATSKGAQSETLHGLSGLGDLVLTCTSEKSRNFSTGVRLGQGLMPEETTIEGIATAEAVAAEADRLEVDLPLIRAVADVANGKLDIPSAIATLLARPVGKE